MRLWPSGFARAELSVFPSYSSRLRQWQDQAGQQRSTTEIVLSEYRGKLVMLGGPGDDAGAPFSPWA
jgi:hypothetical protein